MRTPDRRRLPGSALLKLAERQQPFARRVLLAIVADLQFEWCAARSAGERLHARLRGTWAFARAMAPVLAGSAGCLAERLAWGRTPDDRAAGWRLLKFVALATTIATIVLLADVARHPLLRQPPLSAWETLPLLLPGVLSTTIPAGCLLGVLMAGRRAQPESGLRWRPFLTTALSAMLVTFALAAWWTPRANRAHRRQVAAALAPANITLSLSPGRRELTLGELEARRAELLVQGDETRARGVTLEWHKKPALAASCLALAFVGLAVTRARRIWVRVLLGWAAVLAWGVLLRGAEQAADAGIIGPVLAMWGPVIALLIPSLLVSLRGRHPGAEVCAR